MSFLLMAAKQSPLNSRIRSGKRGFERLEDEIRTLRNDELRDVGEAQKPRLDEHGVFARFQLVDDELLEPVRHLAVEFEADHMTAPAPLEQRFV